MKQFLFDCGFRDPTASLGILTLRVLIGLMMFIGHGIPKIRDYASMKEFFYVPDFIPASWAPLSLAACIGAEVVAATFVIIGFMTRPAAFVLGFAMVVAAFGKMGATPWFLNSPTLVETKELPIVYLITMLAIILAGAGNYSCDAALYRESKRRRW